MARASHSVLYLSGDQVAHGSGRVDSPPTRRRGGEQTMYSYELLANTYASRTAVVFECSLLSIIFRAYTLPGTGASGWMHLGYDSAPPRGSQPQLGVWDQLKHKYKKATDMQRSLHRVARGHSPYSAANTAPLSPQPSRDNTRKSRVVRPRADSKATSVVMSSPVGDAVC